MEQKSIRELDSLSDRIRLHRQVDPRGVLVVEGPSDQRLIRRLFQERWAVFLAGTRNVVISTVEGAVALSLKRIAGLIDQDFDGAAAAARQRGLPIFWYENADLEAVLFTNEALDNLLGELASAQKLHSFGGVQALRLKAISTALEIAALRAENAIKRLGLPFDNVDLSKKIDRHDLSFKRSSYCQALADVCSKSVDHDSLRQAIEERVSGDHDNSGADAFFSGKDALVVVGVALKSRVGTCDSAITKMEHLAGVLRLSAPSHFADNPPFPAIATILDVA
jgi:hypothetical protein